MLKSRFQPAIIEYIPYADPEDPMFPSFGPASMMGQCPAHGLERITEERVGGGSDPTQLYIFQCGTIDPMSFGPAPEEFLS